MKFVEPRPFGDPDVAARKLIEIASTIEPVQNGRIFVELVNVPFLKAGGLPASTRQCIWASRRRSAVPTSGRDWPSI